jgi:hypothetical protein
MGAVRGPVAPRASTGSSPSPKNKPGQPVTMESYAPAAPTVEMIRGDKRANEVIR